jgi:hypothetical protein
VPTPVRPPKKEPKRPLDPHWMRVADEIYMRFNMLQGYDRPTLMEWVGTALRDAYELGEDGKPYAITEPSQEVQVQPVRRTRPAVVVESSAQAPRVVRRVTRG